MKIIEDYMKVFLQYIIYNPIPRDKQEYVGVFPNFWCSDYWTIEVAKCFFIGEDAYMRDPIPKRYRNNSYFSRTEIIKAYHYKLQMLKYLKELENITNNLLICEVGWGLDIFLARTIKDWNITCFDYNNVYAERLEKIHQPNVKFIQSTTDNFNYKDFNDHIAVCNHSKIKSFDLLCSKDVIIHFINDGELIW